MSAEALVPEAALRELLRSLGVHEVGSSALGLAPYRSNLESPPANLDGSPELADLLPPEVRVFCGWRA